MSTEVDNTARRDRTAFRIWPLSLAGLTVSVVGGLIVLFGYWDSWVTRSVAAGSLVAAVLMADASLSHLWWCFGNRVRDRLDSYETSLATLLSSLPSGFLLGLGVGLLCLAVASALLPVEQWWTAARAEDSWEIRCENPGPAVPLQKLAYVNVPYEEWVADGILESGGRGLRLFDHSHRRLHWNLVPIAVDDREPAWHLVFPIPDVDDSEIVVSLYAAGHEILPSESAGQEIELEPLEGSEGIGINRWKREMISAVRGPFDATAEDQENQQMIAPFGDSVIEVVVEPDPDAVDHGTNQAIPHYEYYQTEIGKDTYLEYDIRAKRATPLRASVQVQADDSFFWSLKAGDQLGLGAEWSTDLNPLYTGRWFHRRISLRELAGKQLNRTFLMTNDEPLLRGSEPVTFYFDNIRISNNGPAICRIEDA